MTDRSGGERLPDNGPVGGQSGVRVLPLQVSHEALRAGGARPRGARPPKIFRPERLSSVSEMVPRVRAGEPVVLHVDRLDEPDRLRAFDVATGIAAALDATVSKLDATPGVSIVPRGAASPPTTEELESPFEEQHAPDEPKRESARTTLCVFCDLREPVVEHDPPFDVVVMRDGSRAQPPRIGLCGRCHDSARNWRFTIAWCSTCERWGRRGVRSSCGVPFGS